MLGKYKKKLVNQSFCRQIKETLNVLVNLRLRPQDVRISTEAKQDINHVQRQHYSVFVFYSVQNKILLTYIAWHTFKYHPCVFHAKT